jgi:hypothetical protein
MSYADFLARGLPIGSGPVEAACPFGKPEKSQIS